MLFGPHVCQLLQKQEAFLEGHVHAFHHFGGVPRRLTYDNLTTAVRRILEGRNREEQETFISFRSHYLYESNFCNPREAHEKGKIENGVGFGRRNFLVPPPVVSSYEELNAHQLLNPENMTPSLDLTAHLDLGQSLTDIGNQAIDLSCYEQLLDISEGGAGDD